MNSLLIPTSPQEEPVIDSIDHEKKALLPPAPAELQEELIFEAKQQITLRCGKASITLYPNGKIALRGEYIISDAVGVNRIIGSQVELN